MKFQDDISNMNTYIHTYIRTDKPKPICTPPLFQSWGHNDNFQSKAFDYFHIFAQNIDCGYTLEPPL